MKIIGAYHTHTPSQETPIGEWPAIAAAVSDPQALSTSCRRPQRRDSYVKSQSLSALEFDNRGFPRQPRSRGDQEACGWPPPCRGPRVNGFMGTHDDRCQ